MAAGDWWRHGVIYQIYPRSFADSDGDGIGDLAGITAHLDHLNDGTAASLGVDAIWLSPFYRSPMKDFGYDVSDYRDVDPMFGTLADFDELLAQAHRRGIRVIVDLVPNHTSDQHPWFVESRSSRDNPRRDWYVWADPRRDGAPPNNWRSAFPRVGPAWTWDEATGQWYLHSFLPEQPDLNWWNPEVRRAIEDVMRFWLDRGVDGFRIDVAHKLAKDPELADNPLIGADQVEEGLSRSERLLRGARRRVRLHDNDWPEVHDILRRFRRLLDRYDDRMAVGEVYLLDLRDLVRYYGEAGDELHLAHNFVFLHQPWRADRIRETVDQFEALLPRGAWPDYFTGNHDHPRVASRYDEGGDGQARARAAAVLLLTLRGTPFVYQGEEIGMTDVPVPPEQARDVDGRDPERTPVPWDASPGAGFTTGRPWLPLGAGHRERNVAAQRGDPASTLSLYRRLIRLRRASPALHAGGYRPLDGLPDGVFAYLREHGEERLLVAVRFTGTPVTAGIAGEDGPATLELSTDPARGRGQVDLRQLGLGPNEAVVVRLGAAGARG